jgi:hypothetical protein
MKGKCNVLLDTHSERRESEGEMMMKNEKLIVKFDDLTLQHYHKLTHPHYPLTHTHCPRLRVSETQQAQKVAHQYKQNAKSRFFFGSIS